GRHPACRQGAAQRWTIRPDRPCHGRRGNIPRRDWPLWTERQTGEVAGVKLSTDPAHGLLEHSIIHRLAKLILQHLPYLFTPLSNTAIHFKDLFTGHFVVAPAMAISINVVQ